MPATLLKEGKKVHVDVPPADRIGVQSTPANEEVIAGNQGFSRHWPASAGWADSGSPTSTRHREKLALDVRDRCRCRNRTTVHGRLPANVQASSAIHGNGGAFGGRWRSGT